MISGNRVSFRWTKLVVAVAVAATVPGMFAAKVDDRLEKCAIVMEELINVPDGVPKELLDKAECVMVIPSVKKLAIGFGGSYGRGAMVCRQGEKFKGKWGAPAMVRLEGGNVGFQLGGQATDFLLLVMNPKGAKSVLKSKVKLGADAAVAAGPKGRTTTAATDAYMRAEILAIRGREVCLRVCRSKVRRCGKIPRRTAGSTAVRSTPGRSCWAARCRYQSLGRDWRPCFRRSRRSINRTSPHFSPPDGRSTRQARQYFVALARRAQRTDKYACARQAARASY